MKQYRNGMKATEFTKKQIGVIYRMAKAGDINLEKWIANDLYNLADYYGYDDNRSVEDSERKIMAIIDKAIERDVESTQKLINEYTERTWELSGRKTRERADRSFVA